MNLERISLIVALIGIIALIFLSESLEAPQRSIASITSKDIDSYVMISGNITYIKQYSTSTLFEINDSSGKLYAIAYGSIEIKKGPATVTGKIVEYRGILELEAQKILQKN